MSIKRIRLNISNLYIIIVIVIVIFDIIIINIFIYSNIYFAFFA
jgi:hypothetical protein